MCVCVCTNLLVSIFRLLDHVTVPYEGDNFANSKMDHFSLIFKTSFRLVGMFFMSMLNMKYI